VRLLVALGEADRLGEVVLFEELRELGGELPRCRFAFLIWMNFVIMIVSEKTDIRAMMRTMPFAKLPIVEKRCRRSTPIVVAPRFCG
jgi:hypothetical protein